jgi:hypothetical protein
MEREGIGIDHVGLTNLGQLALQGTHETLNLQNWKPESPGKRSK